jgi:hypothetical protein
MIVENFVKPIGVTTVGERVGERVPRYSGFVGNVMDKYPLSADSEVSIDEVARLMYEQNKSYCLIIFEDKIVGIITPRELLKPLLRYKEEPGFPVYVVGLSDVGNFLERAIIEEKINRVMKRALKIHPHLSEVSFNIQTSREKGNRTKFEVTVNVYSNATEERFNISKVGWDPIVVFNDISQSLDRVLRDSKHEPKKLTKRQLGIRYLLREKPN